MSYKSNRSESDITSHLLFASSSLADAVHIATGADNIVESGQVISGLSDATNALLKVISDMHPQTRSGTYAGDLTDAPSTKTLEEVLFDACAAVKVELSWVSMHLSKELRDRLTNRIDQFHDPDAWEADEKPIQIKSLKTFIRWFYLARPEKLPSFGMSDAGYLVASWMANQNKDQLFLEFLPKDKVRWYVALSEEGQTEYANGDNVPLMHIGSRLQPYGVARWFSMG